MVWYGFGGLDVSIMKHVFLPDVLAANPGLDIKSSKAKTPSGKGHGHTDDAQAYDWIPPDPAERIEIATRQYIFLLERFAALWEHGESVEVSRVFAECRAFLEFVKENR